MAFVVGVDVVYELVVVGREGEGVAEHGVVLAVGSNSSRNPLLNLLADFHILMLFEWGSNYILATPAAA